MTQVTEKFILKMIIDTKNLIPLFSRRLVTLVIELFYFQNDSTLQVLVFDYFLCLPRSNGFVFHPSSSIFLIYKG